jgi:hypothetical protein
VVMTMHPPGRTKPQTRRSDLTAGLVPPTDHFGQSGGWIRSSNPNSV